MVMLQEIISNLEKLAPPTLAEKYDNVGLLIGDRRAEVDKVLISLDTDEAVAEEAAELGARLILSHHPLIFRPVKNIVADESFGRTASSIIRNHIALYAMHTNFDSVCGGLCDEFLSRICPGKAFASLEGDYPNGIGRIAETEESVRLGDVLETVKENFGMKQLRFVGDAERRIRKIAVCNGGGADLLYSAAAQRAELYLTGDLKYHHARFAYENGIALVEIPHYEAEIIFCRVVYEHLQKRFSGRAEFFISQKNVNPWNIG